MYLDGQKFKNLVVNEFLWTNHHAIVSTSWFVNIKYEKQVNKWLEARSDQQTARKTWSDYVVICFMNKLDLTCAKKPIAFIHINPTDLNYVTRK